MKNVLLTALSLLYCLSLTGQTIINSNFETTDTTQSSGFQGWRCNQMYEMIPDRSAPYAGSQSVRLSSKPGKNFGAFSQDITVQPGLGLRKVRLSGYLKRSDVKQFAGFWINALAGEKSVAFDNMQNKGLNGTADWQLVENEIIIDESVNALRIGGLLVGEGVAWFDDIAVTIVPLYEAAVPDSLQQYLDAALAIIRTNALNRDSVDWPKAQERARQMLSGAANYAGCYPAIEYVLHQLKDHHSFLMSAQSNESWSTVGEKLEDMPLTTGKILEGNIAYLRMPAVSSGDDKANTYFADQLHNLLDSLNKHKPAGWVLDLRENMGGNCWPMLAGIGPLLGEGICGYFWRPNQGREGENRWIYKKGKAGIDKEIITKVSRRPARLGRELPKLAVLTGGQTASSGEVVTVAFRARPNCRSFGQPTMGLTTGNANFPLPDGAQIFLTSSVYVDRTGRRYGGKVEPDVTTAPDRDGSDPALEAAVQWLTK